MSSVPKQRATKTRVTPGGSSAGETIEWTNLREDGVLVPLSSRDIEVLSKESIDEYRRRRDQEINAQRAEKQEEQRFAEYRERYVAAGGSESGAQAAYQSYKQQQAPEVAARGYEESRTAFSLAMRREL